MRRCRNALAFIHLRVSAAPSSVPPHPRTDSFWCLEGLLVAKAPLPLLFLFASPSPAPLTVEICRLKGLQLPEFPWQQPPWRSLLPAKTLISETGCCCFSGRFTNRRRGKRTGRRQKKFAPGGRERINYRATHSGHEIWGLFLDIFRFRLCPRCL